MKPGNHVSYIKISFRSTPERDTQPVYINLTPALSGSILDHFDASGGLIWVYCSRCKQTIERISKRERKQ